MTLIVGIKCSDGIVVAADGAATLGSFGQQTAKQPVKKLCFIGDDVLWPSLVLLDSASVSRGPFANYTQRKKNLLQKKPYKVMAEIRVEAMDTAFRD